MIRTSKQFCEYIQSVTADSAFLQRVGFFSGLTAFLNEGTGDRAGGIGGVPALRPIGSEEIQQLQSHGNRSTNWDRVFIGTDGLLGERADWLDRIRGCAFSGSCLICRPDETEGLWNSFFHQTVVLQGAAVGCSRISNTLLAEDVTVFHAIVEGAGTENPGPPPFGIGTIAQPGLETGGRALPLFPDLDYHIARYLGDHPEDTQAKEALTGFLDHCLAAGRALGGAALVDRQAVVRRGGLLVNAYIGPGTLVNGALEIRDSAVLSTTGCSAVIGPGTVLRSSVVKPGAETDSGAVIENSAVFEYSHVEKHAKVSESLIGPETGVAEGEVTACFLGPHVGFHHQALLISAFWPDGKGNVAYGANVGSNHTSRLPDQEIRPGEGMFFGLGASIKFPADFSKAPYSVIATGVLTLPQRMELPFSLIVQPEEALPGLPPAYNHLYPGWCLYANLYMCVRSEMKFAARSKLQWEDDVLPVFRRPVMEHVLSAYRALSPLRTGQPKTVYVPADIPEIGKNYIRPEDLLRGIEGYAFILEYYFCKQILQSTDAVVDLEADPLLTRIAESVLKDDVHREGDTPKLVNRYAELMEKMERLVLDSLEKDWKRGGKIFDNYEAVHPDPEEDAVYCALKDRHRMERDRLQSR